MRTQGRSTKAVHEDGRPRSWDSTSSKGNCPAAGARAGAGGAPTAPSAPAQARERLLPSANTNATRQGQLPHTSTHAGAKQGDVQDPAIRRLKSMYSTSQRARRGNTSNGRRRGTTLTHAHIEHSPPPWIPPLKQPSSSGAAPHCPPNPPAPPSHGRSSPRQRRSSSS